MISFSVVTDTNSLGLTTFKVNGPKFLQSLVLCSATKNV